MRRQVSGVLFSMLVVVGGKADLLAQSGRSIDLERGLRASLVSTIGVDGELTNPVALLTGANNTLFIGDRGANAILVAAPNGKVIRRIGQKGEGPGDYTGIQSLAWKADTLAVLDDRTRRITLVLPSGRFIRAIRIAAPGTPAGLHQLPGGALVLVMSVRPPATTQKGVVQNTPPPQLTRQFWHVSPGDSITRMTWADDSSPTYWNSNCETRDGWIRSVEHPFAYVGRLHAFSRGDFVVAQATYLKTQRGPAQTTSFAIPVNPIPITQTKWDSLTAGFQSLRAKHGAITCNFVPARTATFPLVRTIFSDALGRVWTAVDAKSGSGWMVWDPRSPRATWIEFAHPSNVIVAAADGDRLYTVRRDDDNGPVVDVFAIGR